MTALQAALEAAVRLIGPCEITQALGTAVARISAHDGKEYVVDFEHARTDLPLRDLVRLRFRVWPARPDLKDAFLSGYGRDLTGSDTETLQRLGALDSLTAIARGHQNRDIQLIRYAQSTLRQLRASG